MPAELWPEQGYPIKNYSPLSIWEDNFKDCTILMKTVHFKFKALYLNDLHEFFFVNLNI